MKKPAPKAPVKGHGGGPAGHGGGGGKGGAAAKAPAAGKHQAKAKAKPAKVSRAVHRARRQAALRGAATRKQHAAQAKKRGLALGPAVACCSAEALAASLRLSGWPVSDADVLALYWHTARDEHAGASILATLEAAGEFGLAGVRPAGFDQAQIFPGEDIGQPVADMPADAQELWPGTGLVPSVDRFDRYVVPIGQLGGAQVPVISRHRSSVVLGLALPAPHAVLDTGSEWITWGEAWPITAFPDVAIEEAWEVTWPS